jgi:tetratricopeptide (TPR) repeat protein
MGVKSPSDKENKWPKRLGFLFLFLFALLWSIGPFFFITPLALSLYFFFLHFYHTSNFFDSIRQTFYNLGTKQKPTNPFQSFRPRSASSPETAPSDRSQKVFRSFVLGFIIMFFTFFLIGIFSDDNEPAPTEESVVAEDVVEDERTTLWNEKGNIALNNNLKDSALYYYDQALAIDPENMYALYNKSLAHILSQEYRKGNGLARRCLALYPNYDPAWWLLGYSYDLTNETDSSLYCLEQAYQHAYTDPEFFKLLAEVYVKKNRRSDALAVYQKVVEMDTTQVDIYRKMAELDPSNAEQYLRKARALEN